MYNRIPKRWLTSHAFPYILCYKWINNKCGRCIYSCTCAKFPNVEINPNLFIIVLRTMIYKPFNLVLVIQIVYAWWRKNVIRTYSIYPIHSLLNIWSMILMSSYELSMKGRPNLMKNNSKFIENMITCNKSERKTTSPWQIYKVKWNLCLQHNL